MVTLQLPLYSPPSLSINLTISTPVNVTSNLIISLLDHSQSLSKVIAALTLIHKVCRTWRRNPNPPTTWSSVKTSILISIISCFASSAETIIANNRLKHLVIQPWMEYTTSQIVVSVHALEFH